MTLVTIDTDAYSARLRAKAIDPATRRLLVTNFHGSRQEEDLSEPANCRGFGRIRHFRRASSPGWPPNPLLIDPASRALGLPPTAELRAQVFQNAACNWRCWYCFVDFALLAADLKRSALLSASELVDLYFAEPDRPSVIDLTGGQPDLVPEWVPWVMRELQTRELDREVYLWSDDNLSNDYFWRFLDDADRELVATYPLYGKVGCFKGFNAASFAFNTRAESALFERQFALMERLLGLGLDLYAYATFTTPSSVGIRDDMARFVERLQALDSNLPLRTVPLEIVPFTPVRHRRVPVLEEALAHQWRAVEAWQEELGQRFSSEERARNITDVPLGGLVARQ